MANLKVGKIKDMELQLLNSVSERKPPVTSGLIAHLPLDGSLNHHAKIWSKVKVLGFYNNVNHYMYDWFNANCIVTNAPDINAVTTVQAQQYDLVVADACVWGLTAQHMQKLKDIVDAGVSVIATGNDTNTSCFVTAYTGGTGANHDINIDPDTLVPTISYTNVAGSGSVDVNGGISGLIADCKPYYRRADTNLIMGYIYTSPVSGAALFFDQDGDRNFGLAYLKAGYEYVLGLSRGNITVTGEFNEQGLNCYEPRTNLLAVNSGLWGDCGFSNFSKSSYTTDSTYKRSIVFDPDSTNGICLELETLTDVVDWNTALILSSNLLFTDTSTPFTFTIRYKIMQCEDNTLSSNSRNTIGVWSHWHRTGATPTTPSDYILQTGTVLYPQDWKTQSFTTTSPATDVTGRHFYLGFGGVKAGTKYRVDFVQFEKASYGTGFINGTRSSSGYLKLPNHWSCETGGGNDRSVVFKYIPTTSATYGTKSVILGMGIEATPITNNYVAIRRSAEYGSYDNLDYTFQDGTTQVVCATASVTGINARINHDLWLGVGWTSTGNKISFWAYDGTTSEVLLKQELSGVVSYDGFTNLTNFNIGGDTSMSANGIFSNVGIYNRLITGTEFLSIARDSMNVAGDGTITCSEIIDIPTTSMNLTQSINSANSTQNLISPIFTSFSGVGNTESKAFINGSNCTSWNITSTGDAEIGSPTVTLDPNSCYEFSVWMTSPSKINGQFYFGYHVFDSGMTNISNLCVTQNGVTNGNNNVYFYVVANTDITTSPYRLKYNKWYQVKGYLLPSWFDIVNDSLKFRNEWLNNFLIEGYQIFKMPSNTAYGKFRLLNFYNSGTSSTINFAYPEINKINPFRIMKDKIVVSNFREGVSV
jgi:hypothetical protein